MIATFTETCRTAPGAEARHWSHTRGGVSSSPSMGLQVATAWGWLEFGYGIARQTVMGIGVFDISISHIDYRYIDTF